MGLSLEIDLLRSFVVIAEVRALSRAAARVGRTQSALSQQMKRLEEVVDQPLFQRTGRGVVLTHPGERLLVHAQRILRLHDEAMADPVARGCRARSGSAARTIMRRSGCRRCCGSFRASIRRRSSRSYAGRRRG